MKEMSSDEARRNFRQVLNDVEHDHEHVAVQRYGYRAGVIVDREWYEDMADLAAMAAEIVESGGLSTGNMEWLRGHYREQAEALRKQRAAEWTAPATSAENAR